MKTVTPNTFSFSIALLLSALLVSACSSSSDSQVMNEVEVVDALDNTNANDAVVTEDTVDVNNPVDTNDATDTNDAADSNLGGNLPESQSRTQVNFDITVPVYQPSDALQLRLFWGDIDTTASWVGDEYWSASIDLPTNTEHVLSITFYDNNGDIELASFSQNYKTGVNAAETFTVTADQFDADQWDADGDGINNLDELVAGTDPHVDEDSLLEIYDLYVLSSNSRLSVSQYLESRLSVERPFFKSIEEEVEEENLYVYEAIDISAKGNGTLSYRLYKGAEQFLVKGIRTHSGASITWEGTRGANNGDYAHGVSFTNTVTVEDDGTRSFKEENQGSLFGPFTYEWTTSSNLTGRLIEGTSLCEPVAGTVLATYSSNPNSVSTVTTVTKEINDPYWRVVSVANETETSEYFVRKLEIFSSNASTYTTRTPEDAFFICDFVDI